MLDSPMVRADKWMTEFPTFGSLCPSFTSSVRIAQANMDLKFVSLPTLDELKSYVLQFLCAKDQLDSEQTVLSESLILQSGRPCGIFFHVQGPRSLKTYAVWPMKEERILFYDSTGARFAEARLTASPELLEAA
jgi:hypothetical protein